MKLTYDGFVTSIHGQRCAVMRRQVVKIRVESPSLLDAIICEVTPAEGERIHYQMIAGMGQPKVKLTIEIEAPKPTEWERKWVDGDTPP